MADTNTVRTLTVRQIQDASAYVAGAKQFVAANKDMAASSSVVGTVVTQTQAKISSATDPISRLVRAYDQSSSAAIKFNNDLSVLNRQLEGGKVSAEAAGRIYAGMVGAFGSAADGADLMAQGFVRLGGVVTDTNAEMLETARVATAAAEAVKELAIYTQKSAALKAELDPAATSFAKLNASIADYAKMLQLGLISSEEFGRAQDIARAKNDEFVASLGRTPNNEFGEKYAVQARALIDILDPVAASQRRLNEQIAEYSILLNLGEISTQQFAQAEDLAKAKHDAFVASLNAAPDTRQSDMIAAARAQQVGQNFTADLNDRLGINASSSARESAAAFIEEAAAADMVAQKVEALRAAIDPIGASQLRLNAQLEEYAALLRSGSINLDEFTKAEVLAKQRHDDLVASLNRMPANDNLHGGQNFQATNLAFQLQDVATTAAFMPWYTVALQQGPQAAMAMQGMEKPVQGLLSAFTQMVNPVSLVTIGLIGAGAAAIHYFTSGETAARTFDETLKKHRETLEGIKAVYGSLSTDSVTKFSIGGRSLVDASAQSDLASLKKELQVQQKAVLAQMAPTQGFGQLQVLTGNYTAFSDAVTAFMGEVARGNPDLETFDTNVDAILQKLIKTPGVNAGIFADTAEDLKGMAEQAVAVKGEFEAFSGPINKFKSDIANGRDGFADFVRDVSAIGRAKGIQDKSAELIGFGEKLLQINAYLVDLKKKMDDAFNNVGPGGFLLSQGTTNQADDAAYKKFLAQQQVQLDRSNQIYEAQIAQMMARTPVEKKNAAELTAGAQYNEDESDAERKQRIELAGAQALIAAEHDLRLAKEDRVRTSQAALDQAQYELSLTGKTVEERNRLMATYQAEAQIRETAARAGIAADETEIKNAKEKAAAIADINSKLQGQKLIEDQGYQLEQLQLEARLIGASADQRARETAILQAQQQLRQQGIDLLSREGQQYIANAAAMAQAKQEIDRQNAAYQSLQQAEGDAIDTLVTGSGSIKDVLNSAKQWLLQTAVANPLKNAFTGTNLPTITDLFSGRPSVPGASSTSTAMMNVTATTVMINGSPVGGLPGVPGATGLAGLLGYNPAAKNATSPSSLIGAAANQNIVPAGAPPTDIEAYIRSAAIARGIDPNTAVSVAKSEGGLTSWNARSNVIMANGQREPSFGPFQMYMNGGLGSQFQQQTGLDPRLAENGPQSVNFALDNAQKNGWTAFHGAANTGISQWQGINRNAPPVDTQQINNSLNKLSTTTTSTSKDLGSLGDTTNTVGKTLTDTLGASSSLAKAPAQLPSNYFPPAPSAAPTSSFNPLSIFTSLFSLFGFADGSESTPEGWSLVGERGPELRYNPRGSRIVPNHKISQMGGGETKVTHYHEWNVVVSGNGDKELMGRMHTAANESIAAAMSHYDANILPSRVQDIQQNPRMVG